MGISPDEICERPPRFTGASDVRFEFVGIANFDGIRRVGVEPARERTRYTTLTSVVR